MALSPPVTWREPVLPRWFSNVVNGSAEPPSPARVWARARGRPTRRAVLRHVRVDELEVGHLKVGRLEVTEPG